jgi:hypothetical protein
MTRVQASKPNPIMESHLPCDYAIFMTINHKIMQKRTCLPLPLIKEFLQIKEVNTHKISCFDVEPLASFTIKKTYNQFHELLQYPHCAFVFCRN